MKKLLLLALAACLPFSVASAQLIGNIYYGNTDGSVLSVTIDSDIEVECWVQTDAAQPDAIGFMHNPLGTDDLYVNARLGGTFVPPFASWDDISYLAPNPYGVGKTNQSVLGFAELGGNPVNPPVNTNGIPMLVGSYIMHTVNDPALIGQTLAVLEEGTHPVNGGALWGNADGTGAWDPIHHFSQFFFSPNNAPVWGVNPSPVEGCPAVIHLTGTDADAADVLQITLDGVVIAEATGGSIAADYTIQSAVPVSLTFFLTDGIENIPMVVDVVGGGVGALEIGCVSAFPGTAAYIPVSLTNCMEIGGFELLINFDPTALTFVPSYTWFTDRTTWGSEYHNQIVDPVGPGTIRLVWIADINNGVPGVPMAPGAGAMLWLQFNVSASLPFGMNVPINFLITDYTDNTVSDETGYDFIHPPLVNGCVNVIDQAAIKGDPNMNCFFYEIADAVLVAQRLIQGYVVWGADDAMDNVAPCTMHYAGNDPAQEGASDLNDNSFCDIADLVRFINIINGYVFPKLDPTTGTATVTMANGAVTINSGLEVGAVLVRMNGDITPSVGEGFDMMVDHNNGITSVLVYSLAGNRIAAGNSTVFTYTGEGTITEVSAADAYGRLLDASAREGAPIPTEFAVQQNYPNPFNAQTAIKFDLPTSGNVTISIYNIAGQLVKSISDVYEAGSHQVNWDASDVASGVYFAKVASGDNTQTVKMTLLK